MRITNFLICTLALLVTLLGRESGGAGGRTPDAEVPVSAANEPVDFERAEPGQFSRLETEIGTWVPEAGLAIIDNKHAKSGRQCLQLKGGEKTSVVLQLADGVDCSGMLTFWAERWTSRSPFSFRIDKGTGDVWQEVFNGDATVRVGRSFLNHVKIPLGDATIERLRFTVTSPPNTGVLIDDLRIAPAQPQKILGAGMVPVVLPALVGAESSPLAKLRIETSGILDQISVVGLRGRLDGTTDLQDVASIHVRVGENRHETLPTPDGSFAFSFPETAEPLEDGENDLWIGCKLSEHADIGRGVGAAVTHVSFSNGQSLKIDAPPSIQRLGVAVRRGGDDGVHTYRIPGLATTNQGTLIGVYDIRRRGGGDLPGDIDVGMSRSTDGGRTWEPMKTIMDMGDDPQWHYDGIGDPAVLVDRNTGTIWVVATWSHGNRSWRGSGPGMTPEETGQLMLVRSDDDGVTWSKPINITPQVKRAEWCFILQGPGKGITMRDGTLVFAAQYQDPPENRRLPHSTIIYSKDHGETWQVGTGAFDDTTEAQVVEIEPGVLMLNCRYNRKPVRVVMTTRDMGRTWQKHPSSERALIEPGACMASLIDADLEADTDLGGWLLFSNPDSLQGRRRISIKASSDRGLTWPKQHRLLLDEGSGRGYSCLSMIDEQTVGILYEGSQADMTFQRIPLADLIGEPNPPKPPGPAQAGLRLPQVFGDHMVLQADAEIPIWGKALPLADVAVTFGDETRTATADADGHWSLRLAARKANAVGKTLCVRSSQEAVEFEDVVIGEVWVCAGQSNMQWTLAQSTHGSEELAEAEQSNLRLLHLVGGATGSSGSYTVEHLDRLTPERFCEGRWQRANAASARDFSAVAWYFGRYLQRDLDVPVGLICPAVGGTPTEAWIPRDALAANPELDGLVNGNWLDNPLVGEFCRTRGEQNLLPAIQAGEPIPGDELGPNHSFKPGFMWSAGIEPLIPYAIRGAVWYQGESNAETPASVCLHGRLFPLLIEQWRSDWKQGDFPFLYVQLPAINRPEWPLFRDGQRRALDQLDNVGMAITIDTGLAGNVHPPLKKPVGKRLAAWALGSTYQRAAHATYSGPLLDTVERDGNSLIVSFKHAGDGLTTTESQLPRHFEICGPDGVFHPAEAKIVGATAVAVSCHGVAEPAHVRYAWQPFPNPPVNLVNSAGLPASPFTTESEEEAFARRNAPLETGRPNIVLIVADDLGFSDLGCYGSEIRTPVLDGLAGAGLRYAQFYNAARCCPSRACLLTGLYPHQAGIGHMTYDAGEPGYRGELSKATPTIAEVLRRAGYFTAMSGKWHVTSHTKPDSPRGNWPCQRGFDEFFGTLPGHGSLWAPAGMMRNSDPIQPGKRFFYTDAIAEHATEFIEQAGEHPLFLYVAFTAPHYPLHARQETIDSYDGVYDAGWDAIRQRRHLGLIEKGILPKDVKLAARDPASIPWSDEPNKPWQAQRMQAFAAMVTEMDTAIGRIVDALKRSKKLDNTVLVFQSDNGGSNEGQLYNTIERMNKPWTSSLIPTHAPDGAAVHAGDWPGVPLGGPATYGSYGPRWANVSNTPFRRHKSWVHEGGIATPCIVHWPGHTDAGKVTQRTSHLVDLLPTFAELAGIRPVNTEGRTLVPLTVEHRLPDRQLGWEHEGNRAFRRGKWKIVSEFPGTWTTMYPYDKRGDWELYDLENDRTELRDLADEKPAELAGMVRRYQRWVERIGVVEWSKLEGRKE